MSGLWPLLMTRAKLIINFLVFSNNVKLISILICCSCGFKQICTTVIAGNAYFLSPSFLHIHGSGLVSSTKLLLLKVFMSICHSTLYPLFGWNSFMDNRVRCSRCVSSYLSFVRFHKFGWWTLFGSTTS
jgi:hypothetical protein